jgi:hypothetical protein
MNAESIASLVSDCKTVARYVLRTDGRVYTVFGICEDCLLVQECFFEGNDATMWFRSLSRLAYSEVDSIVERSAIVNNNGAAIVVIATIPQQQQCNAAKRASTTTKVTKQAYAAMLTFMVANHCGMIIRVAGNEYGIRVVNNVIMIEGVVGDYPMRIDQLRGYTVRKQWDTVSMLYSQSSEYSQWELSYAKHLWRSEPACA